MTKAMEVDASTSHVATDEVELTLADGTPVAIRAIQPSDKDALRQGITELSARSRFFRFHGAVVDPSPKVLAYLTEVDGTSHVAIVATTPSHDMKVSRGIGVARFVRDAERPSVAEAAVAVADAMQGRGVGSALLRELSRRARAVGVEAFRAEVLESNAAMRELLEAAGAAVTARDEEASTLTYEVSLDEPSSLQRALRLARSMGGSLTASLREMLGLSAP